MNTSKNQPTWQGNLAALRQGDISEAGKLLPCDQVKPCPSFGKSSNAFDAVAENRFTYGKAKPREWDFDTAKQTHRDPISKAEGRDKRQSGSHIFKWTPVAPQPCSPVAAKPSGKVAVSQSDRVTKRFRVTKIDPITNEESSILVTMTTNVVSVLSYGQLIEFSHSNRAKGTFGDSRDGKRKPLSFAKSELRRLLGATEGDEAYNALVTLPPKRPATVPQGSTVAAS